MTAMDDAGYDVLITFDQNLPYQQNAVLPISVLVLIAQNNRVETALLFAPLIQNTLAHCLPGQLVRLEVE
jgi:hypothetical protein